MPNYQNNMRYGRQGNMRQPCGNGYGMQRTMPHTEARCNTPSPAARADSMQRGGYMLRICSTTGKRVLRHKRKYGTQRS